MQDLDARGLQPVAIDDAREPDARIGIVGTRGRLHVECDEKFSVGHATLRRHDGAGAGGQQQPRRLRLAPLRHAVGIAGEHGLAKVRIRKRRAARTGCDEPLDVARDALHMRRHARPLIKCRQQIGRRRRRARRQHVTFGQQRAGLRHLPGSVRRDEHARQPRMQRQPLHLFSDGGQRTPLDGAETLEQRKRGRDPVVRWAFEPLELTRIASPGDDVEHGGRQIDAMNLGFAMRTQPIVRVPQPPHGAGSRSRCTASALVGRIRGDALDLEAVDRAVGVVARDFLQTRVDNRRHAGHRHRGLSDVCRDDDPATAIAGATQRLILDRSVE